MDDMIKNWDRLLPIALYYDHLYEDEQKEISREINEFYFNNEPFLDSNRENMTNVRKCRIMSDIKQLNRNLHSTQLFGDSFFIGILENVEYRLRNNLRDQTYFYQFSHKGSASFSEVFVGGAENFYGTCHSDELIYLFPVHKTIPTFFNSIPSKEDKEVTRLMVKLWVNFAASS